MVPEREVVAREKASGGALAVSLVAQTHRTGACVSSLSPVQIHPVGGQYASPKWRPQHPQRSPKKEAKVIEKDNQVEKEKGKARANTKTKKETTVMRGSKIEAKTPRIPARCARSEKHQNCHGWRLQSMALSQRGLQINCPEELMTA